MEKLTVLIVEDDPDTCEAFKKYAKDIKDISIIDTFDNSFDAVKATQHYLPDAIILDLELHLGGGDGLDFMRELNQSALPIKPYILVTTNNSSAITHNYARQLGADFILTKFQSGYSEKSALSFLQNIATVIKKRPIKSSNCTFNPPIKDSSFFKQHIIQELNFVGISPKAVGFQYLIDAILIIMESPGANVNALIAEKYGKTESSVERAMQNAINKAWRTSNIEDLFRFYTARINSEKGTPTNTEFIHYYARKINDERN